jgi:hypothetical protein
MTAREVAKPKITHPYADKMFNVISNGFEHAANLAIDSLSQDNAQADGRHGVESRNPCSLTVEKDSAHQFRRERGIPRPIQCYLVFLLDFVTRMRKPLCEIAVVCEKQQTFGLCIQTPDVEQGREFSRQQIKDGVAYVGISPGRNESGGFVQHDGERRRDVNKFAIHLHVVARVGLHAEVNTGFTVDSDPPGRDQFIAVPTRSDTGSGEEAVQAHYASLTARFDASTC